MAHIIKYRGDLLPTGLLVTREWVELSLPDWLINIARTRLTHKNIALYFFLCSTNQFISFALNTQGEPPI